MATPDLESQFYGSQTKILEEGTKDENRIFEVLLAGVSTRFGRRTLEKSIENPHFIICSAWRAEIARFQAPYLTTQMIIREYLHLGKFARLNSTACQHVHR